MSSTPTIEQFRIIDTLTAVFGSRGAVYALLYLQAYGSGYATAIARTFDMPIAGAQQQLLKLEREYILVSKTIGRTRIFEFNPRNTTAKNLQQFLTAELENMPRELYRQYFCQRQRPRRSEKPLNSTSEKS